MTGKRWSSLALVTAMLAGCGGSHSNEQNPAAQAYESNAALAENMSKDAERAADQLENQADALRNAAKHLDNAQ